MGPWQNISYCDLSISFFFFSGGANLRHAGAMLDAGQKANKSQTENSSPFMGEANS